MPTIIPHQPLQIKKVESFVYRAPIDKPVQTSFGIMHDRPAVAIRLEDNEGCVGWGEIWCNFPGVGPEHRARLFDSIVAPILLEKIWASPVEAFQELTNRLHILGIQCGEPGTIAQAIAGADIALWDLLGKKIGKPLWELFGGTPLIETYASGISPTNPEEIAEKKWAEGFRAFKLKVGFSQDRDFSNLQALRNLLGPDTKIMVDANQAWDPDSAARHIEHLAPLNPYWVEEPIAADRPIQDWNMLASQSSIALAAGENMRGETQFYEAINSNAFQVIQPDIGKWGGFSGCIPVAKAICANNQLFCPHWLGGGIGLVASMHLKAAVGQAGFVEVDSNPNILREAMAMPYPVISDGKALLSNEPGLGIAPKINQLIDLQVKHYY
ncbi:MAG: mandelate racemase/muconate lactonizing enzyme family protein [Polynucleobacter sp.]|nr:mandelate racemase/muconate lactonizing enzyme family protein [Polynucleobacter sp.]